MLIKSRAKRTLTIQLPAGLQSPAAPLTRLRVRRSRTVRNALGEPSEQRVPTEVRLPGAITIFAGEQVEVPRELKGVEQFKAFVASRELVILREDPEPPKKPRRAKPAETPKPAKPARRGK